MKRAMQLFAIIIFPFTASVYAGSLDSSNDPSQGSQMYSIDAIYNRLNTGAAGTMNATFSDPATAPGGTGHTLNDVMGVAPIIHSSGSTSSNVLENAYFWGLRTGGGWGLLEGLMPNIGRQVITPGISNQMISLGYHNGTGFVAGDPDLIATNIAEGVNIFNEVGTAVVAGGNIVDTSTGDATSVEIKNGEIAWVDGSQIAGSNGSCIECTGTLSPLGRWCDNGDGTVTDMTSGLVWLQDAGGWGGRRQWDGNEGDNAHVRAGSLFAGATGVNLSDNSIVGEWRLPTYWELKSLTFRPEIISTTDLGFFTNMVSGDFWSSTTSSTYSPQSALYIELGSGSSYGDIKTNMHRVWPVRERH